MWLRVDDTVEVITGNDAGVRAKVLSVDREQNRVVVEGVNRVLKHVRKSQRNPQGGRLSKELSVAWSNVMLVCESCNAASRTGAKYQDDGSKVRYCKKCGAQIGRTIAPARSAHAKTKK
ncbi:MAG: 50S ribosomal protein L24 [Planctomycetota bacterium]|nr:50S ribosomal protein L24 [Planctomycetota bacterium]